MGTDDKVENSAQEFAGKAKEAFGKATNNDEVRAEGQADQTKANLKQAGEHVKDALKYRLRHTEAPATFEVTGAFLCAPTISGAG